MECCVVGQNQALTSIAKSWAEEKKVSSSAKPGCEREDYLLRKTTVEPSRSGSTIARDKKQSVSDERRLGSRQGSLNGLTGR